MNKLDALLAQFSPEEIATGEITGKPPKGLLEVSTPQDIRARVEQIMIGKQIGAMLRDARVKRGLTLENVASVLQVSKARVSQLEQANANLELKTLARYAAALDLEVHLELRPR
jgi:ribosome-binding protein aMBF1 (putative translation factor)